MVEFQSKAGECCLATYSLDNAPDKIKGDLIGESAWCGSCKNVITIRGVILLTAEQ
jgi:hypothetical protein